jgi:hypothetical protein
MVMIQVLIASVELGSTNEFGIELGLQDSVLFDRSLLGSLLSAPTGTPISSVATTTQSSGSTLTQSVGSSSTSNNNTQSSSIPSVIGASNTPGYAFAGSPLGNGGGPLALATAPTIGSQGFSNFGTGTTNSTLGFGGLVLQASSENVSALLRALQEVKTMHVLSRPQIMTLDNQPAYVQVGERVPRIQGTSLNAATQVNSITLENVGLILGVRPRISPEGIVVMELDAENSSVGPEATGTPVSVSNGTIIRSPAFTVTMAQTTVSVASGQTVILAGLITDSKQTDDRKVPILGDIPVINWLFHYTSHEEDRTELLIILTPHVVHSPEEAERVKQVETARMHWCLKDVESLHGDLGIRDKTPIVYPDLNPRGKLPGESFTPGKGGTDSKPEEVPAPVPKTSRWPLLNFGHTADSKPPARPDANTMAPTEPAALEEPSPALKPPANSPSSSAAAALAAPAGSVQTGYQQSISAGATPGVVYPAMPQGPQQPQPDSAAHYTVPVAEPPTGPQEPINRR